jgi:GAF domain-containing protein
LITTYTIDKSLPKKEIYQLLLEQITAITSDEEDLVANLSNICSVLKYEMNWFWVGFYHVKQEELVLGTFQGPVACTRIKKGKGVCGVAWKKNEPVLVPNVDLFEGHIACSSITKSEIVLPLRNDKNECTGVLDIDSEYLNTFDEEDKFGLELIVNYINQLF